MNIVTDMTMIKSRELVLNNGYFPLFTVLLRRVKLQDSIWIQLFTQQIVAPNIMN